MVKGRAQRLRAAVFAVEEATTQLLMLAERFGHAAGDDMQLKYRRKYLLEAGRMYGRALQRLNRVR